MTHTHCCYCRRIFTKDGLTKETIDHFIPVSRGGKESGNKLQCCHECNQWKSDRMPEIWLSMVDYFIEKKRKRGTYSINDYKQIKGSLRHFIHKMSGKIISDYKYKVS